MSEFGYRRNCEFGTADDENGVVSGHRADPACGHLRDPKLAPSFSAASSATLAVRRRGVDELELAALSHHIAELKKALGLLHG
jgi:hypothetical protein